MDAITVLCLTPLQDANCGEKGVRPFLVQRIPSRTEEFR